MRLIKKTLDITNALVEYIAMIFLTLMVGIISMQVFTRYFLGMTPRWSEEVALILMVWFAFLGIAIGVKKGIHISIEYFASLCPKNIQNLIIKLDDVLVGLFGGLLAFHGSKLVQATTASTLPATQWPAYILYLMVPVSGIMIVLYSIAKFTGILEDNKILSNEEKAQAITKENEVKK